ncbi:MAG: NAD-binding protein [Terrimicrobiaceae bacterium]
MAIILAVVGAGVIGAEYGCTFRALGAEVHILDGRDVLLPFLDAEVRVLSHATSMESIFATPRSDRRRFSRP